MLTSANVPMSVTKIPQRTALRSDAPGGRADRLQVAQALACLLADIALDERAGRRVQRRLPRQEEEATGAHRVAVGTHGGGGVRRGDRLAVG